MAKKTVAKAVKKRNPQDATLRNARAATKRDKLIWIALTKLQTRELEREAQVAQLRADLDALGVRVTKVEQPV